MAQELKAFDVGLGRYSEDGSPCIVAFDADQNPRVLDGQIYLKDEVDAVLAEKDAEITELKAKLESVQASMYADVVDAGMENRRLKRALYKACSNWAKSERYTEATWHGDEHREESWANVQTKCLAKVEQYK